MTGQTSGVVHRRIAESIDGLSPQLRRAARYVVANPEEVAMHSLREVAQSAGVAPPTLSRLPVASSIHDNAAKIPEATVAFAQSRKEAA